MESASLRIVLFCQLHNFHVAQTTITHSLSISQNFQLLMFFLKCWLLLNINTPCHHFSCFCLPILTQQICYSQSQWTMLISVEWNTLLALKKSFHLSWYWYSILLSKLIRPQGAAVQWSQWFCCICCIELCQQLG